MWVGKGPSLSWANDIQQTICEHAIDELYDSPIVDCFPLTDQIRIRCFRNTNYIGRIVLNTDRVRLELKSNCWVDLANVHEVQSISYADPDLIQSIDKFIDRVNRL